MSECERVSERVSECHTVSEHDSRREVRVHKEGGVV